MIAAPRPLVTVSMPTFNTPEALLRRAVRSVLDQRMDAFRLVVTCDGEPREVVRGKLGDLADDPRVLITGDGTANRGRYYADAVCLAACDTPYFTIHDSDDMAAPFWLSAMLDRMLGDVGVQPDVVFTDQAVISIDGSTTIYDPVLPLLPWETPPSIPFRHYAHGAGLWSARYLRRVGGPHPRYRVGWDSMASTIAMATARVDVLRVPYGATPTYTRFKRVGSLTTSPQTSMRSSYRRGQRAMMVELWDRILGGINIEHAADAIPIDKQNAVGRIVRANVGGDMLIALTQTSRLQRHEIVKHERRGEQ